MTRARRPLLRDVLTLVLGVSLRVLLFGCVIVVGDEREDRLYRHLERRRR